MRRTAAVLSLLVLLTGCSNPESGGTAASSSDSAARGAPPVAVKAVSQALPRAVVRTAELHVRVPDARRAVTRAEALVRTAGGQVASEDVDVAAADPVGQLLLLVPPDRLTAVLDGLARLGDEQLRRLGSEDVTEQVVDLDARLATQRTGVQRVRALLEKASSLSDVIRIEAELTKRQSELESLEARSRALAGQVAMAKVTLRLTTAEPVAAHVGFVRGLRGGWHAFLATARVTAATAGAVLPFLPVLLAGAVIAWWVRRRGAPA
ncbi:MAG: DUF4349 domain-containing protein [Actinobacteria bacterium]|nr:DUF4349 domain-containing protein [Actinomycetota bacterium]MCA1722575.1 DUF4349 domain-containing protein [Actinomycetota bacterium]